MKQHLIAISLLLCAIANFAWAQDDLGDVWRETQFDRVAIQTGGMEKSLATFARDILNEIALHRQIKDDDPITLVLTMASQPGLLADRHLIPVEGDPLLPMLEAAGIQVENRTLRLRDCIQFDPATNRIVGEGTAISVARTAVLSNEEGSFIYNAGVRLFTRINAVIEMRDAMRLVPDPHDPQGLWMTTSEAVQHGIPGADQLNRQFNMLTAATAMGDAAAVRQTASALVQELRDLPNYTNETRLSVDYAYTTKRPYFWASFAYVVSAALFFIALVTKKNRWWWAAMVVMTSGWLVHILGAAARGYLIQRMPLSNLYEATTTGLVFIILFALILEGIYRMRVVGLCSAALAFIYYRWLLSSGTYGNDAIEPLRAVLNSYWLDYHVTCMMLSYGAFTVAFGMAILYLLRSHLPRFTKWTPTLDELDLYIYRAIQFGWPLLGIGIVLGAVWADTAWGRMWSWDPKETWSLITWLIYTAFIHVRLVHGWKGKVMAWASIAGYCAVLFTYLGVNFILSGLHSYAGNNPVMASGIPIWLWVVIGVVGGLTAAFVIWFFMRPRGPRGGSATLKHQSAE